VRVVISSFILAVYFLLPINIFATAVCAVTQ
jgi:hypothetical protein